jgi:glucose/arabinose dehydrogenase
LSFSGIFAQFVALVGTATVAVRRMTDGTPTPAWGKAPAIPAAKPQGAIPTLKMPTARGWHDGRVPVTAPGLKVNAFAAGLEHPRWLCVLPNGDVLVAESSSVARRAKSIWDYAQVATMKRAAAMGVSANRITLLRDADGDGVAEIRETFLENLNQPFGMALVGDTFYVGNTDGLVAYPYEAGATSIKAAGRKICDFKPGGHWTRSLLVSPDETKLYVGVGSMTNIADNGMEEEEGRAAIHEIDLATGQRRIFATGLRNAVGMAWEPVTGALWTVVNERDGLGDETPPDYLTSVVDGGFYGWPYCYWDRIVDDRVPQDAAKVASATTPDYALGGHTASLGLCWLLEPQYPQWLQAGLHPLHRRPPLGPTTRHPLRLPRARRKGILRAPRRRAYGAGWRSSDGGRCRRRRLARHCRLIWVMLWSARFKVRGMNSPETPSFFCE